MGGICQILTWDFLDLIDGSTQIEDTTLDEMNV